MTDQSLFSKLKSHWGEVALYFIIALVIIVNFKPGYFILGNDNFSPELNPRLTFERSVFSPGWRAYRAVGIASDSEQSDIFRTSVFLILSKILPAWFISQGYLFFTLSIACISMGYLGKQVIGKLFPDKFRQMFFFLSGLFYLTNLTTSWIYFSPVHLFVATYAFLPLVLWRLGSFMDKQSLGNTFFLLVASLFLSTSALTPTMFFIGSLIIIAFSFLFFITDERSVKGKISAILLGLFIVLAVQSFWVFSFINYGKSNAGALQESAINRNITSLTLQTERKNNTWANTLRYYFSWMDTRENPDVFTFPHRNWYKNSSIAQTISFIPITLALIGVFYLFKKKKNTYLIIPLLTFIGWFFIKGANPPFGFIIEGIQSSFPIISQVFRWQSSKFWPFLAITVPLLATIGLIYLHNLFKIGSKALIILTVLSMLLFVYPYFKGDLIREKVFVKVPKEYFALAKYLEKNDRFSRIYLAPEANTLYFRNYSWGFWGSVLLNYMVPNPIIEKALIIGSRENEQAFTVIKNSYYSENSQTFSSALRAYGVDLVLLDEHASRGDVGYFYDQDIAKKVIIQNGDLEEIWNEGKLTLYKLKSNSNTSLEPIYFDSDFTKLNQIRSALSYYKSYYSKQGEAGIIYPLALNFDEVQFNGNEIIGEIKYKGKSADYSFLLENDFSQTPTQINFDPSDNKLFFHPLLPFIQIDKRLYLYDFPVRNSEITIKPTFVTINGQILDFRKEGLKTASTFFDNLDSANIRSFSPTFSLISLANVSKNLFTCDNFPASSNIIIGKGKLLKCQSPEIKFSSNSISELLMQFESKAVIRATLCIESRYKKQCVNENTTVFIQTDVATEMLIPQSFQAGDIVRIYLDLENQGKKDVGFAIKNFQIKLFENSEIVKLNAESGKGFSSTTDVSLSNNEVMYVHIPVYGGENSWTLAPDNVFIPASSMSNSENSISIQGSELSIKSKKGSVNIYPNMGIIDGRSGIGMAAIDGYNRTGIPLFLELKNENFQFALWDRQIFSRRKTKLLDLFLLPHKAEHYKIEAKTEGIGAIQSENRLNSFVLQVIPKTWYGMKLLPNMSQVNLSTLKPSSNIETNTYIGKIDRIGRIYVIPTAYSKDWQLTIDGKVQRNSVLVNGWQQGWEAQDTGEAKVIFIQNKIIYMGFLPLMLIVGLVIVKASRILLTKGG